MVLGRLITLLKAKLNKGMSQLETPEVLAEQAQDQLESNLKKLKEALVASVTTQKSLEQQIKKSNDEIASWEKRAAMAVQQNSDDLARECLKKKQELVDAIGNLTGQLDTQNKTTADLKKRLAELEEQIREFRVKKDNIVARGQASDAVAKANELLDKTGASGPGKWEQKIQEKEAKAEALQQMGGKSIDAKFAELDQSMGVEDELAALKNKVGMPKIIVDKGEPGKTVVDDNVPMVIEKDKKDGKDKGK